MYAYPQIRLTLGKATLTDPSSKTTRVWDLSTSPTTLRLLRALRGHPGAVYRKADLHRMLSSSKFIPHLHESRLDKLLKRAELKIVQLDLPKPWMHDRLGGIEILISIQTDAPKTVSKGNVLQLKKSAETVLYPN